MLSEPLSLLVLLAALVLAVLAPAFHYHQFGEAARMARDAGFSALFTCGSAMAVFVTIRAFRREIESGTMEMALAHPITPCGFFLAKTLGAFIAYIVFFLVVFGTAAVIIEGAEIGGLIAAKTGDIARVFGPCLAFGVGEMVLPLVLAAILNRFARCRFVFTAFVIAFVMAALGFVAVMIITHGLMLFLLPAMLPLAAYALVLLSAAAAFAMRFRANVAAAFSGLIFASSIPAIGNYYLSDALSKGGAVPWSYTAASVALALPAIAAMLILGVRFANGGERI